MIVAIRPRENLAQDFVAFVYDPDDIQGFCVESIGKTAEAARTALEAKLRDCLSAVWQDEQEHYFD